MFVPQILIAAEAFQSAVEVLVEGLSAEDKHAMSRGKVICHTVQGDIHDVGKNIVKTMFRATGFEVIDMGRDVPVDDVVKKVKDEQVADSLHPFGEALLDGLCRRDPCCQGLVCPFNGEFRLHLGDGIGQLGQDLFSIQCTHLLTWFSDAMARSAPHFGDQGTAGHQPTSR